MHEEILYKCKFESILALYVVKEWEKTLRSKQSANTWCTTGVLEFMKV